MIRSEEHTGDSGVAIVRHADDHRAAMTSTAAYLIQTGGAERDAVDWVPEFLRRARGTPVYAALRALGRDGVANLVDGLRTRPAVCDAAWRGAWRAHPQRQRPQPADGAVRRCRRPHATGRTGVQADGTCWASGTTWHGLAAMCISVSNWATSSDDVAVSADAMLRVYRQLHAA